jgi:2-polyprenyl-3-methyl-5-hydroxy-6-metoxy-1,4-benzoquinol methylase
VVPNYAYADAELNESHAYLLPALRAELAGLSCEKRILKLGCGNGSIAAEITKDGWDVTGVDVSADGIAQAQARYPHLKVRTGSAYDDLASVNGTFPVVVSLEGVEHLYDPRCYTRTLFSLLEPGGKAIISTPHHGYWKHLALALTAKMDAHCHALWDHGHIKFWSIPTLTELLKEVGLDVLRFERVGRVPPLAKSMIAIATKPLR